MLSHSRLTFSTHFVLLLLTLASFASSNQEDLNAPEFIRYHKICNGHTAEYEMTSLKEHYFLMFTNRAVEHPASSFEEIIHSAAIMLEEWQALVQVSMNSFKKEYMNVTHYSANFMSERFEPFNNVVWTSLKGMFTSESRFTDWIPAENRNKQVILNEFSNLIVTQRALIEEFETIEQKVALWKKKYPQMEGELVQKTGEMFTYMKQETINYLALIFISAFEFVEPKGFASHDNILQEYWAVFYDWLEINRCDRLMNGAMNGALFGITDKAKLTTFLNGEQSHAHLDQIKLVQDVAALKGLVAAMPAAGNLSKLQGKWGFFNEANLNSVLEISMNKNVGERIEFDKVRIEEKKDCLVTIQSMSGFIGLKEIMENKNKFLSNTVYYYLIEHFGITVETDPEFVDVEKRRRAIKVIYIFINHIMNTEQDKMKELEGNLPDLIIHIIIRILNGMGVDGDLLDLVQEDMLDEVTRDYIYLLFLMITENNDLPKPNESEELNKGRNNNLIDDDEEDPNFRIDPQNPRFVTIIRRMYQLAGKKAGDQPKFVKRYVKKYYSIDLLRNNEIFKQDNQFYLLELAMNREFKNQNRHFPASKKAYNDAKKTYFSTTVKVVKDVPHNIPMVMLAKYFGSQISEIPKYKEGDKKEYIAMRNNKITKILLGHFTEMKSNFMENQYVQAIFFTCKQYKLPLPNFEYLLENEMEDSDKLNMFEFIKRIISNLKHNKARNVENFLDTVDINTTEYDDRSDIINGERFRTMILDIENFFKPELKRLENMSGPTNKAQVNYSDLKNVLTFLENKFNLMKNDPVSTDLKNFRLMMTWNIFDDLAEYMPLLGDFIVETKGADPSGNNPLKVEIAVENYNSLYLIILEHRLFAAANSFSFENGKDRIDNLYAYLQYKDEEYQSMFENALPEKEIRFSKLSSRQVQNTLYFLRYRMKKIATGQEKDAIKLSHVYYPYSFREIYMLVSNHSEVKETIHQECEATWNKLAIEKKLRVKDYTKVSFSDEEKSADGFKFCILLAFNKDMIELIEAQATANSTEEEHMKTLTRETIFLELVVPYYDKMTAHELIIQVFNLNMTHAKAAASESIEKFSNYIALLDRFLMILDDLEDGVNDSLVLDNLPKGPVNDTMKNFCLLLEKSANPEMKKKNMVFIRHLLFEKLRPGFLAPGDNLRPIYRAFTAGTTPNAENIAHYSRQIRYGLLDDGMSIDLKEGGEDIDIELLGMLLVYAPHSEFTADLIYENNFMSALPGYINFAQDNIHSFFRIFDHESSMEQVFESAYNRKAKIIHDTEEEIDDEVMNDLMGEYDIDLSLGDELDDESIISSHNSFYTEHESVVDPSQLSSNVEKVEQLTQVLIGEEIQKIELSEGQSHLDGKVVLINQIISQSNSKSQESDLLMSEAQSLNNSDVMNIDGINVVSDNHEFAEEMLSNVDFKSTTDNQGKVHTLIQDHHESPNSSFRNSVATDRLEANNKCIVKLRVGLKGQFSQANLDLLKNATSKLTSQMPMNQYSVKVLKTTSSSKTSSKLTSKRVSHVSEIEENFNNINSTYHIEGVNDVKVVVSQNGQKGAMKISSTELNSVYADGDNTNLQSKMMDMLSKGVMKMVHKSKSWSGTPSQKVDLGIKKKKTSISSKFLRLI